MTKIILNYYNDDFIIEMLGMKSNISGKFTKYLKLHRGISNEALEVLKQDNEEFGSETIFTLASLHPVVKGGGRNNLNLRDVIMMFS